MVPSTIPGINPVVHIVDDDLAILDSLRFLLAPESWEIRTYDHAAALLAAPLPALGCVLTDFNMPDLDGLQLHGLLLEQGIRLPVIVMTGCGDIPIAVRAMKAGVVDFLEKPFSDDDLRHAIGRALEQNQQSVADTAAFNQASQRIALLTPREHEVMLAVASGKSNKEVAAILEISPRTVDVHRARLLHKLHVTNLPELVHLIQLAEQTECR